jgi:glycogen debranching enzyme
VSNHDHLNWSHGHMTWVDATFQALLSAKVLLRMAAQLGRQAEVGDLRDEAARLAEYANQCLWDPWSGCYFDRFADGALSTVKHIGAYWALLAGAAPPERLAPLLAHLENPAEFKRPHRVPALSADDPRYSPDGGYWCGGVWAPTNYMVIKGLEAVGCQDLAHEIAVNHLDNVVRVFESNDARWLGADQFREYFHLDQLKFEDAHTLWENYSPEAAAPGGHSKPGYVGWTGLPPIAVLLEDVFGLSPDAPANRLTWNVRLVEEHGVHRYPFGTTGLLDLRCRPRGSRLERPVIEICSNIPLTLDLIWEGGTDTLSIGQSPHIDRASP